jgi:AcrR family transcriptional regulator
MGRPRTFDEQEVVEAARCQFWATGYHGTSVGDLAKATGLGKGSLYGAFGDKHQLFLRVFDEYCAGAVAGADARLAGPEDQALQRAHGWLLASAGSSDERGCLLAKGTAELSGEDPMSSSAPTPRSTTCSTRAPRSWSRPSRPATSTPTPTRARWAVSCSRPSAGSRRWARAASTPRR